MNYSRLAPFYQCVERTTIGHQLQVARISQLDRLAQISVPRNVLIVGEGDGRFLEAFSIRFPDCTITIVEPSAGMVKCAKGRLEKAGLLSSRHTFVEQPFLEAALAEGAFDCVITLFFLDNFEAEEVEACLDRLSSLAASKACWLVSDFCVPQKGWRRLRAQIWLWILYRFFRITTGIPAWQLPEIERLIERRSVRIVDRQSNSQGMLFSALYQFEPQP